VVTQSGSLDQLSIAVCQKEISVWLENVVIGLDLCPFARRPYQQGRVRIAVSGSRTLESCGEFLLDEIQRLIEFDENVSETTLVVFRSFFDKFGDFWDFVEFMSEQLVDNNLDSLLQFASFHPDYVFEGEDEGEGEDEDESEGVSVSRSNFTNRAPYPVVHILRQSSMSRAIDSYGEERVDGIPERNIELLNSMDADMFRKRFAYLKKSPRGGP
jgi:hypothetical protein